MTFDSSVPRNGDVATIDGFLATRRRLLDHSSNACLGNFIKDAARQQQLFPEAKRALLSRASKRDQARCFVSLMNWAAELDAEEHGLGFSDVAMDFHEQKKLVTRDLVEREAGDVRLEREMGEYLFRQFLDAVAPRHLVEVKIGQANVPIVWDVYAVYLEPLSWVARHWVAAGEPAIDQNHLIETMTTAFRLGVANKDAIDKSAARKHELSGAGGMVFESSVKAVTHIKNQHLILLWDLSETNSYDGKPPDDNTLASCQKKVKKDIIAKDRKSKCNYQRVARCRVDFGDIPTEILLRFVEFMPLKSLILCQSLSKEWRALVSSAKIHPFRRRLLCFYDFVISSPYFQTLPPSNKKSLRSRSSLDHANTGAESPLIYFQTIPEIFVLWILEWPGRTEISYEGPRSWDQHGTFRLRFFLRSSVCVGWGRAKSEFQGNTFTLVDLYRSPEVDQHNKIYRY